ncbi:MAG: DUF2490 domain-containing protein [Kiritimatiellia bacterium]
MKSRLVGVAALVLEVLSAEAAVNQAWLKQTMKVDAWDGIQFKIEQEEKFADGLLGEETLLEVGYEFCPHLTVMLGHRIVRERDDMHEHLATEQRPTLDFNLTAPEFLTLRFDYRSRFEWREKAHATGYMRYRERLRLRTSWSVTDFCLSPYMSEELFFEDKPHQEAKDSFNRTRTQFGLSFRPVPQLKGLFCNIYYMLQCDKASSSCRWTSESIYGLKLTYCF